MVYEGRRNGRRKNVRRSGGFARACVWLLLLVVAAWVMFPGTMNSLRDRAAAALGVDIDGAVRAFNEERESGAGILGAAKTSFKYAFGVGEDGDVPASDTAPDDSPAGPADAGTDGDGMDAQAASVEDGTEFADLPLPKYVSGETPKIGVSLTAPVRGGVVSPFGYRRGESGEVGFHYGADLAVDDGEPVLAMASGEVMAVGDSTTYGKYVILSHEDGVETIYAHLGQTEAVGGEKVEDGQEIGVMTAGDGEAFLHLELIVGGMYVDPMGYIG